MSKNDQPPETPASHFTFYDAATERSPNERKNRLGSFGKSAEYDYLEQEFAYQLRAHFDLKILDPKTAAAQREILVAARAVANSALHPKRLVERGVKRAEAEIRAAESENQNARP